MNKKGIDITVIINEENLLALLNNQATNQQLIASDEKLGIQESLF